jgi:50S ribosomal subunit-associated GTPase HflX
VEDLAEIEQSKKVFESFLGDIQAVQTPLILCLHKIDLINSRDNIIDAQLKFKLDQEKHHQFYIETTIKNPDTMEILRYLFEILLNNDYQNQNFDFLNQN